MNIKRFLFSGKAILPAVFLTVLSVAIVWAGEPVTTAHTSSPNTTGILRKVREERYKNGQLLFYYLYAYNEDGLISYKDNFNPDTLSSYTFYEYDDHGFLIREGEVNAEDGAVINVFVYENDENGNMTKRLWNPSESGEVKDWEDYTYDESGNMLSETGYREGELNFRYEWTYDESGNILTYVSDQITLELTSTREYLYDDTGHLLSINDLDTKGRTASQEYEWTDDFHSCKVTASEDGELYGDIIYSYDDDGNPLSIRKEPVSGSIVETIYYYE